MHKLSWGKVLLEAVKPFIKFPLEWEETFYSRASWLWKISRAATKLFRADTFLPVFRRFCKTSRVCLGGLEKLRRQVKVAFHIALMRLFVIVGHVVQANKCRIEQEKFILDARAATIKFLALKKIDGYYN